MNAPGLKIVGRVAKWSAQLTLSGVFCKQVSGAHQESRWHITSPH